MFVPFVRDAGLIQVVKNFLFAIFHVCSLFLQI